MACDLNGRKNIYIFRNAITMQIILRNKIPGKTTSSKLQVPKSLVTKSKKRFNFKN